MGKVADLSPTCYGVVCRFHFPTSFAANYCPISLLSVLQALGASCTPAHFSHSWRFTQSRPGWFPERSKHLWSGCCPHHFHRKWIPAEPKDWRRLCGLNSSIWHCLAHCLLYKLSKSMPYWCTRLVGLLLRDRRFRVHMGNDISSWRPQRNRLPQGSVLAPVFFNLYSNDLPVIGGWKFIYADDIIMSHHSRPILQWTGVYSVVRYGADVTLLSTVVT